MKPTSNIGNRNIKNGQPPEEIMSGGYNHNPRYFKNMTGANAKKRNVSMVKDTNYYTIFGWMINRLHLKGTDLKIYAVIFSFSQDGKSEYKGSNSYLADFTGTGERTVSRILADLESRKFIEKTDDNASTGQFNGWRVVPLEKLEALGIIPKEGDSQNGDPPSPNCPTPDSQNGNPTVAKMATPHNKVDNNITDSNLYENNSYIEKESKKVSRNEGRNIHSACARASYDEIVGQYEINGSAERKAVFEFVKHCQLNGHTLTNDAFIRSLDCIVTYPSETERVAAVHKAIDCGKYVIPKNRALHYDIFGADSALAKKSYEEIIDSFGLLTDIVKKKLWEFIQHCKANGQTLSNERLHQLCARLAYSWLPRDDSGRIKALDTAIRRGYYDIKEDDRLKYALQLAAADGVLPASDDVEENGNEAI